MYLAERGAWQAAHWSHFVFFTVSLLISSILLCITTHFLLSILLRISTSNLHFVFFTVCYLLLVSVHTRS